MKGLNTTAPEMIRALGNRLQALHIHDNDRWHDSHEIPFSMNIDWESTVKALVDVDYKGYFTLECCSSLISKDYWLGGRRDFDRDTRLAEPPLFMKDRTEALLYDTAKYILASYDLFEE
jgi:sugar phosphate isomerase/epimerase